MNNERKFKSLCHREKFLPCVILTTWLLGVPCSCWKRFIRMQPVRCNFQVSSEIYAKWENFSRKADVYGMSSNQWKRQSCAVIRFIAVYPKSDENFCLSSFISQSYLLNLPIVDYTKSFEVIELRSLQESEKKSSLRFRREASRVKWTNIASSRISWRQLCF